MRKRNQKNLVALLVIVTGLVLEEISWRVDMNPDWLNKMSLYLGLTLFFGGLALLLYNSRKKWYRGGR